MGTHCRTGCWLILSALAGGCVMDASEGKSAADSDPVLPYAQTNETLQYAQRSPAGEEDIHLGSHQIYVPLDDETREPIDSANRPERLHRDLARPEHTHLKRDDAAQKLVSMSQRGAASWDVFPSQWWAQSGNGIAHRWLPGAASSLEDTTSRDTLSPAEKYDLLAGLRCADEQDGLCTVAAVSHCNYSSMVSHDGQCEDADKHPHEQVRVIGPATRWELQNHGQWQSYAHPDSWWGHCNGWSSYATAEPLGSPLRDVRVKLVDGQVRECAPTDAECVSFSVGDIEALMTELYFSDAATFTGRRCNVQPDKIEYCKPGDDTADANGDGQPDDPTCTPGRVKQKECRDINPGSFHIAVTGMMGENQGARHPLTGELTRLAFVIDHNWDWQVWNFPLVRFQILEEETLASDADALALVREGEAAGAYRFNPACDDPATPEPDGDRCIYVRIKLEYDMISDGVSFSEMGIPARCPPGVSAGSPECPRVRSNNPHRTELNYVLELDQSLNILGGEWTQDPTATWGDDSKTLHPDFLWAAIKPQGWGEGADDTGGDDDNPFISYPIVQALLRCANEPASCGGGGGGQGPTSWEASGTVRRDVPAEIEKQFVVEVPSGATDVVVEMTGATNDADLYVRFGQLPTSSAYDCRPYEGDSNETCRFAAATASPMYVVVRAYKGSIDFQLRATWRLDGGGGGQANEVVRTGTVQKSGGTREERFDVTLPQGARNIRVELSGDAPDADLYVKFGAQASRTSADCRSTGSQSTESCAFDAAPATGPLNVLVYAYSGTIAYTARVSWQ